MVEREPLADEPTLGDLSQRLGRVEQLLAELLGRTEQSIADAARERRVLGEALEIIKDDADFYDAQFVGAFRRVSSKLSSLAELAIQLHAVTRRQTATTAEGDALAAVTSDEVVAERRPRPIPRLEESSGD